MWFKSLFSVFRENYYIVGPPGGRVLYIAGFPGGATMGKNCSTTPEPTPEPPPFKIRPYVFGSKSNQKYEMYATDSFLSGEN